ncbi:MAG: DUF819 family protein [Clostridia bacterium]|nr:DUF819 family protein [Clostridia bacterium]
MIITITELVLTLIIPLLILKYRHAKPISLIGCIGAAYLAGIIYSLAASAFFPARDTSIAEIIAYAGISVAIPLLLFSNNIKNVLRLSKSTLLSFFLLIISVMGATFLIYVLIARNIDGGGTLGGMAVALYTGGTPNLNAVACMFQLDNELILTANLSDIMFGGIFYVFLTFAAKPLLSRFLKSSEKAKITSEPGAENENDALPFSFGNKGVIRNLLIAFMIVAVSFGIGMLIWLAKGKIDGTMTNYVVPALMIGATVGGILLSLNKKVNSVKENDIIGQYFATVFSYSIASIINLGKIGAVSLKIFAFYACITTISFIIHAVLCKVFSVDADTMIITLTAGIYGPAFIPSVSKAVKAEHLLSAGLIVGSLGYAVGTFLGMAYTYFLNFIG